MSEKFAIRLTGVGKLYKLYDSLSDKILDVLNLGWIRPWRKVQSHSFWALRNIDIEVRRGERVGIIGRNGAGKTTMLKLITGNYPPTEGTVEVDGSVQALMDAGAGFHPDFTGRQNAIACLEQMGLSDEELSEALADIADFTELGPFLDQPFKNYSAGMKARLTFATATCLKPDLLIIDEVLGAGDGYFAFKSAERMRSLASTDGATILLVAHDLNAVVRYCERCVWVDRGKIVESGPAMEVVKSYEKYVRSLEESRTKAKNKKRLEGTSSHEAAEGYGTVLGIRFSFPPGTDLRIDKLELAYIDEVVTADVGAPQDAATNHNVYVSHISDCWGEAESVSGKTHRVAFDKSENGDGRFHITARLWNAPSAHPINAVLSYSTTGGDCVVEAVKLEGETAISLGKRDLPTSGENFGETSFEFSLLHEGWQTEVEGGSTKTVNVSRWKGSGEVVIDEVEFISENGISVASAQYGSELTIRLNCHAPGNEVEEVIPAILIFTMDGILATKLIGDPIDVRSVRNSSFHLDAVLPNLRLHNGRYVVTAALYRKLDLESIEPSDYYCVLDKSAEFVVSGVPVVAIALFGHDGAWSLGSS